MTPAMEKIFRYKLGRVSKRITWAVIVLILLLTAFFTYLFVNQGSYIPAWFVTIMLCVWALYVLSIPRSIRVTDEALEIHCVVELSQIRLEDLRSIRTVPNHGTGLWLLLGSYGFFGYYGYYLDWRQWQFVKVYASAWENLVEIEDIYEQRYLVNCDDPEALIHAVKTAQRKLETTQAPEQKK